MDIQLTSIRQTLRRSMGRVFKEESESQKKFSRRLFNSVLIGSAGGMTDKTEMALVAGAEALGIIWQQLKQGEWQARDNREAARIIRSLAIRALSIAEMKAIIEDLDL